VDTLARGLEKAGHNILLFTTGDATCQVPIAYAYPEAERERLGATIPELYHTLCAYEVLQEFDIIHDHTIGGLFVAGLRDSPPVVTTNHGPFTEELSKLYGAVQDRVAVVAISHHQASQAGGLRIARVIHHGLDPEAYRPGAGAGGYLLFLGRMSRDKGVHVAARVAHATGRRLLIAAKMQEPLERQYFREEVEPLLDDDVVYLGEADRITKTKLLADAEALINPIQWPEPFGLVMIEALASGTPVIAFPQGAAAEIVGHDGSGFLCNDELQMVQAVRRIGELDRDDCRRTFVERFSSRRMVQDHLELYTEIVDSGGSKATAA
jgi:glycosyltransferase involved in cell wall biosynthesis